MPPRLWRRVAKGYTDPTSGQWFPLSYVWVHRTKGPNRAERRKFGGPRVNEPYHKPEKKED